MSCRNTLRCHISNEVNFLLSISQVHNTQLKVVNFLHRGRFKCKTQLNCVTYLMFLEYNALEFPHHPFYVIIIQEEGDNTL